MARYRITIFVAITLFLIAGLTPIMAEPTKNQERSKQINNIKSNTNLLCEEQTQGFEKALAIPTNLLTAISLAETGTLSLLPTVSPAPVTAQVRTTSKFIFSPPS